MTANPCDLLIVGAGPVGLTLACEAIRHGLSCRIIEKNAGPSVYSKAQIIHSRTMEIFDDMGMSARVEADAQEIHGATFYGDNGRTRIVHISFDGVESRFPFILSLPQRDTELILAAHLESLGGSIEWETSLEHLDGRADSVSVTLAGRGGEERLDVPWVVGCDGAHSTVRHALGLDFAGSKYPQHILQADVRVDLPGALAAEGEMVVFASPGRVVGLIPFRGEHRYRMLLPLETSADPEPRLESFQQAMEAVGPPGASVSDPRWMVGFNIHVRQAERYRAGHVFLAGDAAHVHSPAGGQGMNTGIQDAYNLAWKLALVHRGKARDSLLDSYHEERHPVGAAVLQGTDAAMRGFAANMRLRSGLAMDVRNRILGFVTSLSLFRQRVSRTISMVDVAYPESPVVGQDRPSVLNTNVLPDEATEHPTVRDWLSFGDGPAPGHRAPDALVSPDDPGSPRLFDLFRGTHHTLLLFDGSAATEEGYHRFDAICTWVTERYPDLVRPTVVLTRSSRPEKLRWTGSVLDDTQAQVHRLYGARAECLYLIRPDGHVAYRSQPADKDKLAAYLDRILV